LTLQSPFKSLQIQLIGHSRNVWPVVIDITETWDFGVIFGQKILRVAFDGFLPILIGFFLRFSPSFTILGRRVKRLLQAEENLGAVPL
jgi:hypothetical protein